MGTFKYRCICCGRKLDEERDLLYDISCIVFEGAYKEKSKNVDGSEDDGSTDIIPIYVPKNEFINDIYPDASAGNGKIGRLSLTKALSYLYSEKNAAAWKKHGINEVPANQLELEGRNLSKSIQEALKEDDEEKAGRTNEQKKAIMRFKETWGKYLDAFKLNFHIEEGGERYCEFKLFELDRLRGYIFQLNKPQSERVFPVNAVRCIHCGALIPSSAFELEQRLIGYVGEQSAGKTCMMVATLNYLMKQHEQDCRLQIYDEGKYQNVIRDIKLYNKGYIVPKTDARLLTGYNISVEYGKGKDRCILTFVDVPGEIFDLHFDMGTAENKYPAILHCDFYIVFARNIVNSTAVLLTLSEKIVDFTKAIANRRNGVIPPFMCAISQIDNADEIPAGSLNNNYDNCYSRFLPEVEKVPESSAYKFYHALSEKTFVTPMACSAYGEDPYDPKTGEKKIDGIDVAQTVETKTESEKSSGSGRREKAEYTVDTLPNKFSPNPKNIDKIIEWIKKMYDTGLYKLKYEIQMLDTDQINNIVDMFTNIEGFNNYFIERYAASDIETKIEQCYIKAGLIQPKKKSKVCLLRKLFGKE